VDGGVENEPLDAFERAVVFAIREAAALRRRGKLTVVDGKHRGTRG
jgi:hypothetical protein